MNDKVLPLFEEHGLPMLRILTDRATEYCGRPEQHDYQLYLAINDIEHTKTKAKSTAFEIGGQHIDPDDFELRYPGHRPAFERLAIINVDSPRQ